MNYRQEMFQFHEESHFQLFQTTQKQETLHCHDCLELNLVEAGSGRYIIGGKLYPIAPGDIFVINNSERHLAIHEGEELKLTVIVFDSGYVGKKYGQNYLLPFFQRKKNFSNRIVPGSQGYEDMLATFHCMKRESCELRTGWQMVMEAAANMLLSLLYRYYQEQQEIEEQSAKLQMPYGRISRVLEYIDRHFGESLTLEQLAGEAALSRTYLCKCFKELTGQTLFAYLEQVRIQNACCLLQTSEEPISRIALDSGFESISYFNRSFKKCCGVTPGQYRRGQS